MCGHRFPHRLLIPGAEAALGFSEVLCEMCDGLNFIHEQVGAGLYSKVCYRLGCTAFKPEHLLHCLDAERWLAGKPDSWFVDLLKYIEKQMRIGAPGWAPAQLVHLLVKKRIFPVEDTEVRTITRQPPRRPLHQTAATHCYGMLAR